jgi:hypothetical protein
MIEKTIESWHRFLDGNLPGGLDELLADDVVFYSPVVFTPQKGKDVTKLYLTAAGMTFGGVGAQERGNQPPSTFRYTKEVLAGHHAVLEFEVEVAGKYINGVDIITCDDESRIREFRVMVRPLQAVNLLHERMRELLAKLEGAAR